MANRDEARIAEPFMGLMQAADLSLNALADASGVPYSTLRRKLTSDPASLTMRELRGIAEALGSTPDVLVRSFAPRKNGCAA